MQERRRAEKLARWEEEQRRIDIVRLAVFDTTELLEAVLLYLPPRDTVVCMRVCKLWSQCIHTSPAMPKHLFLRPCGLEVQQVIWKVYDGSLLFHDRPRIASFDFSAKYTDRSESISDEM